MSKGTSYPWLIRRPPRRLRHGTIVPTFTYLTYAGGWAKSVKHALFFSSKEAAGLALGSRTGEVVKIW